MSDQSKQADSTDPRVQAAIRDYLERVDRGEVVNRDEFLVRHIEIAAALRSFFAAEEPLRKMAVTRISEESAGISTRSIAAHGQETVPPRLQPGGSPGTAGSGLHGQFGRYQILRALGKGAMGAVYLAEDSQLERKVALKTPHFEDDPTGELIARFYREARAAATLRHANICPVHDVGEINGKHFISMAYIEGWPLSDVIHGGKAQNERQIGTAVHKLARALQEAHDHGIVHRDLKPANIMVDKKGEPIIMDFGLARKARKEGEATLTQSGMILGSPAYMSPEQIEEDPDSVGPASDQYSLGVVLYEMLTGQLPFRGSVVNVLAQVITKGATRPSELRPGLDPRLEAVCLQMLSKRAADRFPSMKAVAEQLAVIVKSPAPASASAAASGATKSLTASRAGATPAAPQEEAGASQIRKSIKPKTLTESDLTSLEELVRKCLKRHDYDQMIQIIERIPEPRRKESLQALLEEAREKTDEISFLVCEIDEADRLKDGRKALEKAEELLTIKPRHHRALAIQEKYTGYAEGSGGAARIGPLSRFARPWNEGGWIPWSVLAFGLAVFAVMFGVMVIYLGKTAIVVDIKDPAVQVAVMGTTLTLTGPEKESVKVEPGDQELKITAPGLETTTRRFSLKKGDKKTVTVSIVDKGIVARLENEIVPPPAAREKKASSSPQFGKNEVAPIPSPEKKQADAMHGTAPGDPDRRAAEWVLSIGGTIRINESGQEREMKAGDALPRGAFELTVVDLGWNPKVSDAGLACFEGCKDLTSLVLNNTQVSDEGLANFKDCKNLMSLALYKTQVSDVGLALFKDSKNLTYFDLSHTQVTDAGLANFSNRTDLWYLQLGGNRKVTDAGLAYFKKCKSIKLLDLSDTQVSDAGLAVFKDCRNLAHLDLSHTQVTDAGLANFDERKNLTYLQLGGDRLVTNAGLACCKDCKSIPLLDLSDTQVSESGLA